MSRDVLEQLKDTTLVALLVAGEKWPRGMLSQTPIPDTWMGLVEMRDGRRRFVPAGEDPKPERDDKLLLVRNRAISVPLEIDECVAAKGNVVRCRCEVLLRWRGDEHELAALRRCLMDRPTLALERLGKRFCDEGAPLAVEEFIRSRPAADLVDGDVRDELLVSLRETLRKFLFESGATIERIHDLAFASDTLEQQKALERDTAERVERIKAREMVEAAALAATHRRLDDLKGVLAKLESAASDEGSQWHELLPALSPAERGRLLENLWRITPSRTTASAIVVVCGDECLWFDPACPERITRRVSLGNDLGGLRSVAYGRQNKQLVVGAAKGVWAVDAESGEVLGKYEVPDVEMPRTGFNEIAVAADRLYATHSQLGCWCWPLEAPGEPVAILEPVDGRPARIRAVLATDAGEILFAADDCVRLHKPGSDGSTEFCRLPGTIHALTAIERTLYAGVDDGQVHRISLDEPANRSVVCRVRDAVESIQARRWNDLIELVLPGGDDGIQSVYGEENVTVQLVDGRTPIRRAWACDDVVVGLSDRRDRLVVMNANLPERTARDVPVGQIVGHSIQDACLVVG